jgi:hypothetical protein
MAYKIEYSPIKFYTLAELAELMAIPKRTLRQKIAPVKPFFENAGHKNFYSPHEVNIIFEHLGVNFELLEKMTKKDEGEGIN